MTYPQLPRISRVECNEADYLLFSTNDFISNALFKTGVWDPHLIGITRVFCQGLAQPIVLDIGANLGAFSIPVAKFLAPNGGKVIGFEPQRIVYYQYCANIILNRLSNCYAYNMAIGEKGGVLSVDEMDYSTSENIGAFSLDEKFNEARDLKNRSSGQKSAVQILKLDEFQIEKPPSLIKIDVEGMEINVLKGGVDFLRRTNFPPLLFEVWNTDWFATEKQSLIAFIQNLGYEITSLNISDYIAQHPLNPVAVDFIRNENGSVTLNRIR